jgi:hypothetical protein
MRLGCLSSFANLVLCAGSALIGALHSAFSLPGSSIWFSHLIAPDNV